MLNQPIEDLLPKADGSVYRLARMAANRALELADGKPSLVKKISTDKVTSIALEEILVGRVVSRKFADLHKDVLGEVVVQEDVVPEGEETETLEEQKV